MAETLRDLVVTLSLDPNNFSRNLKTVSVLMKQVQSEFNLAAAGIQGFEQTLPGMNAQFAALSQKLALQREAMSQYAGVMERSKLRLQNSIRVFDDYKNRLSNVSPALTEAREKQSELREALEYTTLAFGAESEDARVLNEEYQAQCRLVTALEKEHKKLSGQVDAQQRQVQNAADAVNRSQTAYNNASAAVLETEAALEALGMAIEEQSSKWNIVANGLAVAGQGFPTLATA